jgi:hypothetical protein
MTTAIDVRITPRDNMRGADGNLLVAARATIRLRGTCSSELLNDPIAVAMGFGTTEAAESDFAQFRNFFPAITPTHKASLGNKMVHGFKRSFWQAATKFHSHVYVSLAGVAAFIHGPSSMQISLHQSCVNLNL